MTSQNSLREKIDIAVLDQRVAQLEDNMRDMSGNVFKIMTNHLPHIQGELASLRSTVGVATAINIGAIILGLVVSKMI